MAQKEGTPIKHLLEVLEGTESNDGVTKAKPGEAVINVPLLTSSASSFYERMRSLLDNKEQHVIRWHTIHRTLGRLMRGSSDDVFISTELLRELVADGFLPNDSVPISVASKVQYILLKYRIVQEKFGLPELFKIAVSEVEVTLYGNHNELYVQALYETVRNSVVYDEDLREENDRSKAFADMHLYIACRRALLEDDESALLYGVWIKYFPEWEQFVDIGGKDIDQIPSIVHFALQGIASPIYRRIARKLRDQSIYFTVLRELLERKRDVLMEDERAVQKEIYATVAQLSQSHSIAVRETGMRAFWYILITKTAVILPVEYFLSKLFFPPVETFPLLVNLVFHPTLLLVMTQTMQVPKRINTDMIVFGVERILAGQQTDPIHIRSVKGVRSIYFTIYFLVVLGVFSFSVWLLGEFGFTPINTLFFMVLLGVISFFAFRVRTKAKKFVLRRYEEMKPSNFWFSIITIPFIDAGRRLSEGFRAINIFTEVMDIFIEVPFKTLVRAIGIFLPFLEKTLLRVIDMFLFSPLAFLMRIKRSFSIFIKERKEDID